MASTMQGLALGIANKILSPNDAREKLDMNPYEGGDVYANPNIGQSSTEQSRAAVRSRLAHLLGVEDKRVKDHLESGEKFGKIEAFYAKWQDRLGDVIEELGGDRAIASEHCQKQIERLLANQPVTAADCVEEMCDLILGGASCSV
jgi:hypothetical protein